MLSSRSESQRNELAPDPIRRRLLGLFAAGIGYEALTRILPLAWWRNQTRIEIDRQETPTLTLIAPGINRKDAPDLAAALQPSLGRDCRPVVGLEYPDKGISARAIAESIRRQGIKKLGVVGHSLGTGVMLEALMYLLPELESDDLIIDYLVALSSPYSKADLKQGPAADFINTWVHMNPLDKLAGDLAASHELNWTSSDLYRSQLNHTLVFNGALYLPRLAKYIPRALYIGASIDENDEDIRTAQAATAYQSNLGDKLTIALLPNIGHADPDVHPDIYNQQIIAWLDQTEASQ